MSNLEEASELVELMRQVAPEVRVLEISMRDIACPVIVRPTTGGELKVESVHKLIDEWRLAPERREGIAKITSLQSFIDHVNRFKDEDSVIFANDGLKPGLLAVLDYHRAGAASAPRFGKHRTAYEFPLSDEWTAWKTVENKNLSQADFAEFLEDRLPDVLSPEDASDIDRDLMAKIGPAYASPQEMLTVSRGLRIHVEHRITNKVNLSSGEVELQFEEEHRDAQGFARVNVPGAFLIGIPVFRKGPPYKIPVRLRYRTGNGSITWFYQLYRDEVVFDDAMIEAIEKVKAETQLPLLFGTPEA